MGNHKLCYNEVKRLLRRDDKYNWTHGRIISFFSFVGQNI